MPQHKKAKAKIKIKKQALKNKKKLFRSNKYICNDCGFIGKCKKIKKGSWFIFCIKFMIILPVILVIITLSMLEGLVRMFSLTKPRSIIWDIGFERFFPYFPYILMSCPDCKHGNSMKKLKTQDGQNIYARYEREHFLSRP